MKLTAPIVAVGAALAGAYWYLRIRPKAPSSAGGTSAPKDNCEAAGLKGKQLELCRGLTKGACEQTGLTGDKLAVCQALGKLFNAVLNAPGIGAQNERLNGPCKRRWHRDQLARPELTAQTVGSGRLGAVQDSCLEYVSGCVPEPSHKGWKKCAKGTKQALVPGFMRKPASRLGDGVDDVPEGTSDVRGSRDPSTFRRPDTFFSNRTCTRPDGSTGQPGWLAGVPKCCRVGNCVG